MNIHQLLLVSSDLYSGSTVKWFYYPTFSIFQILVNPILNPESNWLSKSEPVHETFSLLILFDSIFDEY